MVHDAICPPNRWGVEVGCRMQTELKRNDDVSRLAPVPIVVAILTAVILAAAGRATGARWLFGGAVALVIGGAYASWRLQQAKALTVKLARHG